MGTMILRQPDDLYCVYSTVVDDFLVYDATREELWQWARQRAEDSARRDFDAALERVDDSGTSSTFGPALAKPKVDWQVQSQIRLRDVIHGGTEDAGLTPSEDTAAYLAWLAKWRDWVPGTAVPR